MAGVDVDHELGRLRVAVRKLTLPTVTESLQRRYEKPGRELITIYHAPLITQLLSAAQSTGASYGGSSPQSRNILDVDVLTKMQQLHRDVTYSWQRLLPGVSRVLPLHRYPTVDALTLWHDQFEEYTARHLVHPPRILHEANVYTGWVGTIEAKFDPPKTIENVFPCPKCGERWSNPDELGDMKSAIFYTFTGTAAEAHATCRACGETWKGPKGLAALKRQQDARHAEHLAELQNPPAAVV